MFELTDTNSLCSKSETS